MVKIQMQVGLKATDKNGLKINLEKKIRWIL